MLLRDIPIVRSLSRRPLKLPEPFMIVDGGFEANGVNLTRASAKNVIASDGVLTSHPNNSWGHEYGIGGEYIGRLIEGAATNLALQSQDFGTTWNAGGDASVETNQTTAPDGTTTADRITASSGGANRVSQAITSNGQVTFSVYVKQDDMSHVSMRLFEASGIDVFGDFEFSTATFGTITGSEDGSSVTDAGDGWLRISITATATNAGVWDFRLGGETSSTGTGTKVFLWQADVVAAPGPSSPIFTTTAAASRAADVPTITGDDFSVFYNQSEGTLVSVVNDSFTSTSRVVAQLHKTGGEFTDNMNIQFSSGNNTAFNGEVGNVQQFSISGEQISSAGRYKIAAGYKVNDFILHRDGVQVGIDTSGTLPTIDAISFGNRGGVDYYGGTIASMEYYPSQLSGDLSVTVTS